MSNRLLDTAFDGLDSEETVDKFKADGWSRGLLGRVGLEAVQNLETVRADDAELADKIQPSLLSLLQLGGVHAKTVGIELPAKEVEVVDIAAEKKENLDELDAIIATINETHKFTPQLSERLAKQFIDLYLPAQSKINTLRDKDAQLPHIELTNAYSHALGVTLRGIQDNTRTIAADNIHGSIVGELTKRYGKDYLTYPTSKMAEIVQFEAAHRGAQIEVASTGTLAERGKSIGLKSVRISSVEEDITQHFDAEVTDNDDVPFRVDFKSANSFAKFRESFKGRYRDVDTGVIVSTYKDGTEVIVIDGQSLGFNGGQVADKFGDQKINRYFMTTPLVFLEGIEAGMNDIRRRSSASRVVSLNT